MIGVVVIGRNEGERLRACLASAKRDCATVVYVDSGSTDGSGDLARSMGVHVVDLDLSKPFTAARARNEGFAKLREIGPDLSFVQFVDGDCEIVSGWLANAAGEFARSSTTAVVCGRRRERFPDATIYNRLCDMEWDTAIGPSKACGGDALIRVGAFEQVGGYDAAVIAGEEPEMCVRLRARGFTIQRINAEMTLHDAAITRFSQWWKRSVRAGHAYAEANALHGAPPERFREKELRSIQRWVLIPWIATAATGLILAAVAPRWTGLGLFMLLLYPMLAFKVAKQRHARGANALSALLYGISVAIGKFPQWIGVRRFNKNRARGYRGTIIEYKKA